MEYRMPSPIHQSSDSTPIAQPFHGFQKGFWRGGIWKELDSASAQAGRVQPRNFRLITWNIDMMAPNGPQRMAAALEHLQGLSREWSDIPLIIMLQEMDSRDLAVIRGNSWIQSAFHVTDVSAARWVGAYGTVTLVDHRLPLLEVFRVGYESRMGRDALFVDIGMPGQDQPVLRLCNTHLESLRADPPLRPAQVARASQQLQHTDCGIIAGDFNAIEGFDLSLHLENEMLDTFLELGHQDEAEEGWTWGMQSVSGKKYGCRRMDKVLFRGNLKIEGLERLGQGLKIDVGKGGSQYVTDHLGLAAGFEWINSSKPEEDVEASDRLST